MIAVMNGSKELPRSQTWDILKHLRLSKRSRIACDFSYSAGGGNEWSSRECHLDATWTAAMKDAPKSSALKSLPSLSSFTSTVTHNRVLLPFINAWTTSFFVDLRIHSRYVMPGIKSIISCQRLHASISFSLFSGQSCTASRNIPESISTGMLSALPGSSNGRIARDEGISRLSESGFEWFSASYGRLDNAEELGRARECPM